jgi:hypothetical protein
VRRRWRGAGCGGGVRYTRDEITRCRRLLIVACSQAKTDAPRRVSAYELYDGPAFRIIRKAGFPGPGWPAFTNIRILSAEHGLISPWDSLLPYDRKLDDARAAELAALPLRDVQGALYTPIYDRGAWAGTHFGPWLGGVFMFGGALYRQVVQTWAAAGAFRYGEPLTYSGGGIGQQLGQLRRWLDDVPALPGEDGAPDSADQETAA